VPVKSFSLAEQHTVAARDAELEARRNAAGAHHEVVGYSFVEELAGRLFEESKPAVEMTRVDGKRQMHSHRRAMIGAARQHDGGPEVAHAAQVRLPIANTGVEDRTEHGVFAYPSIEAPHERLDHRFIDARRLAHLLHDERAAFRFVQVGFGHVFASLRKSYIVTSARAG